MLTDSDLDLFHWYPAALVLPCLLFWWGFHLLLRHKDDNSQRCAQLLVEQFGAAVNFLLTDSDVDLLHWYPAPLVLFCRLFWWGFHLLLWHKDDNSQRRARLLVEQFGAAVNLLLTDSGGG